MLDEFETNPRQQNCNVSIMLLAAGADILMVAGIGSGGGQKMSKKERRGNEAPISL